jgi:hypothetical protein
MRAEMLKSVTSRECDEPDLLTPVFERTGSISLRRNANIGTEPVNAEQLRTVVMIMGTGLMMLGMMHTNVAWIQGLTPQSFQGYLSYLLGEFAWLLVARDSQGATVGAPPWNLVLSYEHAIRKKAYKMVGDGGGTFAQCLLAACSDPVTK